MTQRPEHVIVKPPRDSRLESLLCLYEARKQAAAQAEAEFKELKAAILAELEGIYIGDARPQASYDISGTQMYPGLAVTYKSQEYVPAAVIRKHFPEIFEQFKQEKEYSEIRAVKS